MMTDEIISGVLLDEVALTVDELAHACAVTVEWVSIRVEIGALPASAGAPAEWRFSSRDLWRARQLCVLERNFDAQPELAALVVDMQEEIARLRAQLGLGRRAK